MYFFGGIELIFSGKKQIMRISAVVLAASVMLAGCGKKKEEAGSELPAYSDVLSKIKLGMPQKKVLALNNQEEVFYENDTVLWCVNTDTDIMEVRDIIPSDNGYYYCDDSLITYEFNVNKKTQDYTLKAYQEEVTCLIDRDTAVSYYESKVKQLAEKYKPIEDYFTAVTGTEDVDMHLEYETVLKMSSFSVTATMTLSYDTVDGAEGYYCTHISIKVKELDTKTAVTVGSESEDKKDSKKDEKKEEKSEAEEKKE